MVRLSKRKVKEAIERSRGIITVAARNLGCSRKQVYHYINKYPDVKEKLDEEREKLVDMAELVLIKKLQEGDFRAVSLVLKTLGKKRGYSEKISIEGPMAPKIPTPREVLEEIEKWEKLRKFKK